MGNKAVCSEKRNDRKNPQTSEVDRAALTALRVPASSGRSYSDSENKMSSLPERMHVSLHF